jgi:hypothetical protein
VIVILAIALYPQFGLKRSQPTLQSAIAPAQIQAAGPVKRVALR